jgi:hypothetical protein
MIFPFEVSFQKKLNVSAAANPHEILSFLKTAIKGETSDLKDFKITDDSFSFKVNFWGVGRGSDFAGVGKGRFTVKKEIDTLILSYTYVIGSHMVILPFFFGVPLLIILATDYKKGISMIPMAFWVLVIVSALFWFADLFKMNRIFRRMIRQIEAKWVLSTGH